MSLRVLFSLAVVTASYIIIINAQTEKSFKFDENLNGTITCEINGEKFSGDECLSSLKKFGKTVGYIICGVLIIIVVCCCGCWCCVCKVIHKNKHRTRGVVFQRSPPPPNTVIATVA